MASGCERGYLGTVRSLFGGGTAAGLDEVQLLERFALRRDETAFEALVERFGPMVLGVCRRRLSDPNDVDDAFQATFLVLARRAGSIRDASRLGPWLFGVALRVANRARADSARRRARERAGPEPEAGAAVPEVERQEVRAAVDEEVARLPETYRAPVVLCYLEGLTHDEAAQRLRCPVGTVRSRMAWARDRLRTRLTRRGLALPSGLVAATLAPEAVPAALVRAAVAAASAHAPAGAVSAGALALATGVLSAMSQTKLKAIGALALAASLTTGAAGGLLGGAPDGDSQDGTNPSIPQPVEKVRPADGLSTERLRSDLEDLTRQFERALSDREVIEERLRILKDRIVTLEMDLSRREAPLGRPKSSAAGGPSGARPATREAKATPGPVSSEGGRPPIPEEGKRGGRSALADPASQPPGAGPQGALSSALRTNTYLAITAPDRIRAFSVQIGEWSSYPLPAGVSAVPIGSANLVALQLQGKAISELVVFDPERAAWQAQPLAEPASGTVTPLLAGELAVYVAGRSVLAYSGHAGRWDALQFGPDASVPEPLLNTDYIAVETDAGLHVFSARTGRWSGADDPEPSRDDPAKPR